MRVRLHVAGLGLLLQAARGQPACSALASASQPVCDFQLPSGRSSKNMWPPSYAYHSLFGKNTVPPVQRQITLGFDSPFVAALNLGMTISGLSSVMFEDVVPVGPTSWANTPEGEWTAPTKSGKLLSYMNMEGGRCQLTSISVYRPSAEAINLRLNYDGCTPPLRAKHVGVVIPISRGCVSNSGLYEWMCALMVGGCQGQMAKPGEVSVKIDAQFVEYGAGRCGHHDGTPVDVYASTVDACAKQCAFRNAAAAAQLGRQRDSNCSGFEFDADSKPPCRIYTNMEIVQGTDEPGWACYHMLNVGGSSTASLPSTPTQQPLIRAAAQESTPMSLNLPADIGLRGCAAVRQQFTPQVADCFEPFAWFTIQSTDGSKPRTPLAELKHPLDHLKHLAAASCEICLSEESWNLIVERLPIISVQPLAADGMVTSDNVFVDMDNSSSIKNVFAEEDSAWMKGYGKHVAILQFVLVGGICFALGIVAQCCLQASCSRREEPRKQYRAILVEDGPDGPSVHVDSYASKTFDRTL